MKTGGTSIIAAALFPSFQAQTPVARDDGTVRAASSSLHKARKELLASIEIEITCDSLSNESMTLVPVVSGSLGHRSELPAIYINSRKQHNIFLREAGRKEKEAGVLQRKNRSRQAMHYLQSVPFESWMNRATLLFVEKSYGCGIPGEENLTCIARLHPQPTPIPQLVFLIPQVETSKIREEEGCVFINFPVNVTATYETYSNSTIELNKTIKTINVIKNDTNTTTTHISIHSYASPDGPYRLNEKLAHERTRSMKEYVNQLYAFDRAYIQTDYTPEDWEGLRALLCDTTSQEKEAIIKTITSDIHPDSKERELGKYFPAFYGLVLKYWLILLRHSDYIIKYRVRPFTLAESRKVFITNPKNLSPEEASRLALASIPGSETYNQIFTAAVRLFPDNPIANLSTARIALMQKDVQTAATHLEKVSKVSETILVKGVLCFLKNNYEEAEYLFRQVQKAGLSQADNSLQLVRALK